VTDERVADKEPASQKSGQRRQRPIIGIDPLAWLNEIDRENPVPVDVTKDEDTVAADAIQSCRDYEQANPSTEDCEKMIDQDDQELEGNMMESQQTESSAKGVFTIEGPVTIADVSELYMQLKGLIEQEQDLVIDCSGIEGIDASALQLLTAFVNEVDRQGKTVVWNNPSESLISIAGMMGLKEILRL